MIRVLVLGYGPMGLALVRGVLSRPDIAELVGVFPWSTLPSQQQFRHEPSEAGFLRFIQQNNLHQIKASSVHDYTFIQALERLKPDVVLVGSWGEIFKPHLLNIPDVQFINCHPSLLPHHRGPNPYVSVILAGDSETGITFHLMDSGIDTGPILLQHRLPVSPIETGESLRHKCSAAAEEVLGDLLALMAENRVTGIPQPPGDGSYFKPSAALEWINWHAPPAHLDRQFRALYPWSFLRTFCQGKLILIESGQIIPRSSNSSVPPGTVLQRSWRELRVATTDPACQARLVNPYFADTPLWLTPLYRWLRLSPGQCFSPPPGARQV